MPQPYGVKERNLGRKIKSGVITNDINGSIATDFGSIMTTGRQYTASEGHVPSKDGKYREGGPFYTIRMEQHYGLRDVVLTDNAINPGQRRTYTGPMTLGSPALDISDKSLDSYRNRNTSDLDAAGATAISLCAPTNPVATLGTGLAEAFREGLPSFPGVSSWKRRLGILRSLGNEFLNVEFGWLPLVKEITDVRDALKFHSTVIKQYERDANRQVRREFHYPVEHSSSEVKTSGYAGFPGGSTGAFNIGEPRTITTRTEVTRRKWFSGAFIHPPLRSGNALSTTLNAGTEADKLFGIALTPDVLWELTPWSWAIDWFTNAGEVINNVTAMNQYGLIMRYGYMMEESSTKVTRSISSAGLRDKRTKADVGACPDSWTLVTSKVRRPANPFGFGIDNSSLSLEQFAILAAVGISFL